MYSRYMRSGGLWEDDARAGRQHEPRAEQRAHHAERKEPARAAPLAAKEPPRGISSLFKNFKLDLDTSDLLLIAILVFLLIESDDIEIIIALALVLLGFL